jgi:SAM-dependent methyltransferase
MKKPKWSNHQELIDFYTKHRCDPKELYSSERRFLPWLSRQSTSILDVGCAAGGFSQIWKHYRNDISYSGVDLSPELVKVAMDLYHDCKFKVANPISGIPFQDNSFDVVQALGWLFWEPKFSDALSEMWRLTRRWLFFDVRIVLSEDEVQVGEQRMTFGGKWDGQSVTPYLTVAWPHIAKKLLHFNPKRLLSYGYIGKPASNVLGIRDEICFGVFVVEKRGVDDMEKITVCVDLPWSFPIDLRREVNWLPSTQLAVLVSDIDEKEE